MQEDINRFTIQRGRFSGNPLYEQIPYKTIKFKKYFKSIKNDKLFFTNFAKSQACKEYVKLSELYKELSTRKINLDKHFQIDELVNDYETINRLKQIIEINIEKSITYREIVNNVCKLRNREYYGVQFYFYRLNNELNLLLIDIHHLAIPAKINGKYYTERDFNIKKRYKEDISNIARFFKM